MKKQTAKNIILEPIKSKIITPEDNLLTIITQVLKFHPPASGDILVITSKVVAITQKRIKKIHDEAQFRQLIQSQADRYLKVADNQTPKNKKASSNVQKNLPSLTLKNHIFIPWAGVDRSNIKAGYAILWPKDPFKVADQICKKIKKQFKVKNFGIIIADSFCVPLRRGVSAIALGYAGFRGVNDLRGKKDLFKNTLTVTQEAVADNLAVAVQLLMGQSDEQTPFVLIKNAPVTFTSAKIDPEEPLIPAKDCLFAPLYPSEIV